MKLLGIYSPETGLFNPDNCETDKGFQLDQNLHDVIPHKGQLFVYSKMHDEVGDKARRLKAQWNAAEKCFACDRPLKDKFWAVTADDQKVVVGKSCIQKIRKAESGYLPPLGGPALFPIQKVFIVGDFHPLNMDRKAHKKILKKLEATV